MKFLVTGAAGFIGANVSKRLLEAGHLVVGIDNLNDYYDVSLKLARLELLKSERFTFHKLELADREGMAALFAGEKFDRVIHLAAQAGVRYSLETPMRTRTPTLSATSTCWKAAAITTFSICCMPHPAPYMASIARCPSPLTIPWITRFRFMPRPKKPMS